MTRVEGENSRLRHKERTITSQDFRLFQVQGDAALFYSLTPPLFEVLDNTYSNSTIPIMCNAARLVVTYFNWIWQHSRFKTTAAQRVALATRPWTWQDLATISHNNLMHYQ